MNKYEIEPLTFGRRRHHETIIGLLTGLSLKEISAVAPANQIYYTKTYLESFHKLGFNTNPRFKKFDPETIYPCIMRCKRVAEINGYWYGWVYNDYKVYDTHAQVWTFDDWIFQFKRHFRVTSMLQVWI